MSIEVAPNHAPFESHTEWLAQYVVGSFMFSQGSPGLQEYIDMYATATHPENFKAALAPQGDSPNLTKTVNPVVFNRTYEVIEGIIGHRHFSVSGARIVEEVGLSLTNLDALNTSPPCVKNFGNLAVDIGLKMATRDENYLFSYKGLVSRQNPSHPRFGRSLLIDYLVDKKDPHHPVYSHLFNTMQAAISSSEHASPFVDRLVSLDEKVVELTGSKSRNITL